MRNVCIRILFILLFFFRMQQGVTSPIRGSNQVMSIASPKTGYRRVPRSPPKSPLSSLIAFPMRPPPSPKIHNKKNGAEEQLAIFFFQCDEYRTGQVLS